MMHQTVRRANIFCCDVVIAIIKIRGHNVTTERVDTPDFHMEHEHRFFYAGISYMRVLGLESKTLSVILRYV